MWSTLNMMVSVVHWAPLLAPHAPKYEKPTHVANNLVPTSATLLYLEVIFHNL